MPRYETLQEALIQLSRNVSKTRLIGNPGIVEMRQASAGLRLASTQQLIPIATTLEIYPGWNSNDLLAWWPLSRLDGYRDIKNGNDFSLDNFQAVPTYGAEPVEWIIPVGGNSVDKNRRQPYSQFGNLGYVLFRDDVDGLSSLSTFSIGFRIYLEDDVIDRVVFSNNAGTFRIEIANGLQLRVTGSGTVNGSVLEYETWYTVIVTFNGSLSSNSRIKIYVDKENVTVASNYNRSTYSGSIAKIANDLYGRLADMCIWDKVLSSNERDSFTYNPLIGYTLPGTFVVRAA